MKNAKAEQFDTYHNKCVADDDVIEQIKVKVDIVEVFVQIESAKIIMIE